SAYQLNLSYVLTASAKFNETLQNIVKGLQESGFSEKDYRKVDRMPEEEKQKTIEKPVENFLFPEQKGEADEDIIDKERVNLESTAEDIPVLQEIDAIAKEQSEKMVEQIKVQENQGEEDYLLQEMGSKVKYYRIKEVHQQLIKEIELPQFFLEVPASDIFGTGEELLNREALLKDYKLSQEDIKIDVDDASAKFVKVDLEETQKDEFKPTFTRIEEQTIKDPIAAYILAKPKEGQIRDIAHQLLKIIGDMYPIADQEIKTYISRILEGMNAEQMRDIINNKYSYTRKIKTKIQQLADAYAERQFSDLLKSRKISTAPKLKLKNEIVPGNIGAS